MKRVVLGGEGPNELGGWCNLPPYRAETPVPGVLEALLRHVRPDGWIVIDAVVWSSIRKYRAGGHADAEERNVLGLVLKARERGADIVAFARDCDGDGAQHRRRIASIDVGLARAREEFPQGPAVIGGSAVRMLEAWVLAIGGERRTEEMGREGLETGFQRFQIPLKKTPALVDFVQKADLGRIPADAVSLTKWLARAREVLAPS
ncbi:hypothetical protein [Nannocystis bainbridge]|uniref:Uncharacterized protein n=1 Tax=Nannocystis bainbridge TaxID=2995303 RepID=A0ABT5EC98_9BACT|nr:hypothetical protein [Nannocystis bainbridge]MDC0722949.1 hypothetical protein [Nannocystis bainbridge]